MSALMEKGERLSTSQVKRAEEAGLSNDEQVIVSLLTVQMLAPLKHVARGQVSARAVHLLLTNIEEAIATLREAIPAEEAS